MLLFIIRDDKELPLSVNFQICPLCLMLIGGLRRLLALNPKTKKKKEKHCRNIVFGLYYSFITSRELQVLNKVIMGNVCMGAKQPANKKDFQGNLMRTRSIETDIGTITSHDAHTYFILDRFLFHTHSSVFLFLFFLLFFFKMWNTRYKLMVLSLSLSLHINII
jgi:hypothetical protein